MSDNSSDNNHRTPEELKKFRADKHAEKVAAIKAANKYTKDGSKWSLLQEIMQEIIATHTVEDPNKKPYVKILSAQLREEVQRRYEEDPEMVDALLRAIPSDSSIQNQWFKKEGWEDAVWGKVRGNGGIFSKERRAALVNALFERAVNKSDNAAKIWLTLSGDYSEKESGTDKNKTLEAYREINEILHGKKPNQ
jgi:hypothetical protein